MKRPTPLLLGLLVACGQKGPPPENPYEADHASTQVSVSVDLTEYEIRGDTAPDLRDAMTQLGPRGDDGSAYDGYARWRLSWKYGYDKTSERCLPTSPEVSVALYYTMPSAAEDLEWTPQLQRKWSRYVDALWEHQLGHGEIAIDFGESLLGEMGADVTEQSCGSLDDVLDDLGQAALQSLREAQAEYDDETDHGRRDGAVFP